MARRVHSARAREAVEAVVADHDDPDNSQRIEKPAPQGLRPEEVSLLIEELRPLAVGARIEKFFELESSSFLMRFETSTARHNLFFSTRPGFTRFHLIETHEAVPDSPRESAQALRELLSAGVIRDIDQPGGDRILRITVEVPRDGRRIERCLVQELFGRGGRLLVYAGERRTLQFVTGRGGLAVGDPYRFPAALPRTSKLLFPYNPQDLITPEERTYPTMFHRALARTMRAAEVAWGIGEHRTLLERRVKTERERHAKLARRIQEDLSQAAKWGEIQHRGELLKGAMARLTRGLREASVIDYYDAALREIVIALEPDLNPAENVERYFARARKARRGEVVLRERLAACNADLDLLARAAELLGAPSQDGRELPEVEELLRRLTIAARRQKPRTPAAVRAASDEESSLRRFRSRQGFEIIAGKNARDNDRLTFSIANGNDLFFHRAGRPGPHVILRVPRGKTAAPESIEDAAFLAAYLAGWRGPGAESVYWTEAKYVRKPRGATPGKVSIAREREFRVCYQPELLEKLSIAEGDSGGPDAR